MKTYAIFFIVVTLGITACEKESLTGIEAVTLSNVEGPSPACGFLQCDQAIAETKLAYQHLANSICDTIWVDITCCNDGLVTFALVMVAPHCTHVIKQ